MSFFLEFDAKNNILRGSLDGLVTDAILLDCYEAAAKYRTSHPPCRGLWDFSEVTNFDVSSNCIQADGRDVAHNPDWLYARRCRSARLSLWNDAYAADTQRRVSP